MVHKRILLLVAISMLLALTSCNRRSQLMYMQNADTNMELPLVSPPKYLLKSGDVLFIQLVTKNPEISRVFNNPSGMTYSSQVRDEASLFLYGYSVDTNGEIVLPFLGKAKVGGLNICEARDEIQKLTETMYNDASVIVKMANYKITVLGEVRRPGSFNNFNDNLTIFEALAQVGDISENGNRRKVMVVRPSSGGNKTFRLNLGDRSVLQSEAYYLLPNDMIIVEPIGNKIFQMNVPYITLTFSSVSSLILLYNFITNLTSSK